MEISFGEKIRTARKNMGLTQKQLAEKIGAKHNSISDWEKGKNKPDSGTIEALCRTLNMTPNYLLGAAVSDDFSPSEKEMVKKYRRLDARGRELVNTVLEQMLAMQIVETVISEPDSADVVEAAVPEEVIIQNEIEVPDEIIVPGEVIVRDEVIVLDEVPAQNEIEVQDEIVVSDDAALLDEVSLQDETVVQNDAVLFDEVSLQEEVVVQDNESLVLSDKLNASDEAGISSADSDEELLLLPETRALAYYETLNETIFDGFTLDSLPSSSIEVPLIPETEEADFIMRINDDSMSPTFVRDDKLLIQKSDVVGVGDIGVFFVDGTCYIKETGAFGLISHNPRYPLIPGTRSIRCVGRVLGKINDTEA